ncbi:hypothetical protein [Streptomyces sp. 2A115]|uniref:hypothetical protein n=1 Tax=Streptomyces sp. 2A115 TaxID=3457439 RepID=UPI003FD1E7B6
MEALPGYEAQLPNEALDTMVDRVALGRLVVVVGDSVSDRLGESVRAVPVHGYPDTRLVLAWLPDAHWAASHLTATAHAVLARRPPRAVQSAEGRPRPSLGQGGSADRQLLLHPRSQPAS